jgi:hypothetical protein
VNPWLRSTSVKAALKLVKAGTSSLSQNKNIFFASLNSCPFEFIRGCQPKPSRVERRRDMFRSMAPDVSALSSFVANGHQTLHFVSSAPSKIPYGGFSPVRLQTGCQQRPSREPRLYAATAAISPACVLFRSRTYVRRHPQSLTPHTCPVVLGSPGGCIVRPAHRLL